MIVVDTHVHLASPDRDRYPLAPGIGLNRWYDVVDASVDALLGHMDRAGVHATVIVQANAAYRFDNRYALDARTAVPERLAAVVSIDMTAPDRAVELRRLAAAGAGGLRVLHVPRPDRPWLDDPATRDVWDAAHELGTRVQVQVVRPDLPLVEQLLRWAPTVPIALDHGGIVDLLGGPTADDPLAALTAVAPDERVWLKVSPHTLAMAPSLGTDAAGLVRRLVDLVGASRVAWGSDWPNAGADYGALVDAAVASASLLDADEQAWYLGGTALARWPELAPPSTAAPTV